MHSEHGMRETTSQAHNDENACTGEHLAGTKRRVSSLSGQQT